MGSPEILTNVIDFGLLKPDMKCIDFQSMMVGSLGNKVTMGNITFEALSNGSKMKIVGLPAPGNAHSWVPDPIHYLEATGTGNWVGITFKQPVQWVEVSIAPGKVNPSAPKPVSVFFENSSGNRSTRTVDVSGSLRVRTITFNHKDYVRNGGGEFGPPETQFEAGDINRILLYGADSHILVWKVCCWPWNT